MTTIAAKFSTREIAADSKVSGEDSWYQVSKLRISRNSILGVCGDWDKCLKMLACLEKGEQDLDLDVTVLELRNDGIWVYESTIIPAKIKNDFWAIGTGANFAIAAMELGLSPKEAVEVSCKYDPCSGGPIDSLVLGESRGKKNK